MRLFILKLSILIAIPFSLFNPSIDTQEFQGKAYYFSKSRMDLGRWGARLSEAQKKQVASIVQIYKHRVHSRTKANLFPVFLF